jgi:hypothetical protein
MLISEFTLFNKKKYACCGSTMADQLAAIQYQWSEQREVAPGEQRHSAAAGLRAGLSLRLWPRFVPEFSWRFAQLLEGDRFKKYALEGFQRSFNQFELHLGVVF